MKPAGTNRTSSLSASQGGMFAILAFATTGIVVSSQNLRAEPDAAGLAFFENKIRPVLVEHCYSCHSETAKKVKGGLKLDTREDFLKGGTDGAIFAHGKPDESSLIRAVRYDEKDLRMPPDDNGSKKLPDSAISDLETWVKMGAPFPETPAGKRKQMGKPWAMLPLQKPEAPLVKNASWLRTSIDSFILAKMEAKSLQPSQPSEKRALIRRATYDLTGLPPKPEDVDAFLADESPGAFEKVIERLLASPAYGEHWGRHWLDVVRYADTAGDTADFPVPEAWRYRNYVIDSFNSDKPYDVFLREQIAGDILAKSAPRDRYAELVTATGYLAISRRFGFDSENYHHLTIQDTIDTVGQSLLGLTLGCARCHDHKFDPVTMRDYYGLYGIFESTRYAFPGSEQKQKYRAMSPLAPPGESREKWRAFEESFAAANQPPGAILRSLDEIDGDFEMQRAASGGSKGVLVQPWFYEGEISVSPNAQSPFRNLHPYGSVGVNIPPGSGRYAVTQSLPPPVDQSVLYVNMDFRVAQKPDARGRHRLALGTMKTPAVEVMLSPDAIAFATGETVKFPNPGQWRNLQLKLDTKSRTFSGSIGGPDGVVTFENKPFSAGTKVNYISLDSAENSTEARPSLDIDNIAVQPTPIPPISAGPSASAGNRLTALSAELEALAGLDGNFESQKHGEPPMRPWNPGPNSVVKVSREAQSPFRNEYPEGRLGIRLPNSGAYNGFGLTLPKPWKADTTAKLHAGFDFRCSDIAAGGAGSWRFYLGHGPGSSAAVELFITGGEFFRRSAAVTERVAALRVGEWYQVQIAMDLKAKTFTGILASKSERAEFTGMLASGWDGTIDYSFIDSYGHIGGVKPALDSDNFVFRETPLSPPGSTNGQTVTTQAGQLAKMEALRAEIAKLNSEKDARLKDARTQLLRGPVPLAYGVAEGTPHDSFIQIRGEPEKPGAKVPRGFIAEIGASTLPDSASGSGRAELADWITATAAPLTSRVMVNRIWQYHFGRGLVQTPNDFGNRSLAPSHPELLDYLAAQFVKNGWSIKSMHRLIMLSATYQQSTRHREMPEFYAGFPRLRLSAEELRDSILAVSGELDAASGEGHPFPEADTWGYTQHGPFSAVYEHNKRSVYLMVQRIKRHPFLALFDGADPNTSTAGRRVTTVPTQALYFLNDPFVHAKSDKCAALLFAEASTDAERIRLANRRIIGRPPSAEELGEAESFLSRYRATLNEPNADRSARIALAAYVRTLFGSNEFLHLD